MSAPLPYRQPSSLWLTGIPLVLWMGIIFLLSHQNGVDSAKVSGFFGQLLRTWLEALGVGYTEDIRSFLSGLVRKTAHVTEYLILFTLVFHLCAQYQPTPFISSWIFCFAHALGDEYHQSFVPGRGASLADVGIDMIGATLACLLIYYRIIHSPGN